MDLTEIAGQVLAFCASEGIALDDDLTRLEAVKLEQMRRIGAKALELHLAGRRLSYAGAGRPCRRGGVQRFLEHRPKRVAWLNGD